MHSSLLWFCKVLNPVQQPELYHRGPGQTLVEKSALLNGVMPLQSCSRAWRLSHSNATVAKLRKVISPAQLAPFDSTPLWRMIFNLGSQRSVSASRSVPWVDQIMLSHFFTSLSVSAGPYLMILMKTLTSSNICRWQPFPSIRKLQASVSSLSNHPSGLKYHSGGWAWVMCFKREFLRLCHEIRSPSYRVIPSIATRESWLSKITRIHLDLQVSDCDFNAYLIKYGCS